MKPVILQIKVTPRARASELVQQEDGAWVAKLQAPPTDGKANKELIQLVASRFKCSKAAVSIKSGAGGRLKLVQVNT